MSSERKNISDPSVTRPRSFTIHWSSAIVLALFYGGVLVLIALRGGLTDPERMADVTTGMVIMLLVSGVIAWFVYLVGRRSVLAGNIALQLVTVLIAVLFISAVMRATQHNQSAAIELRERFEQIVPDAIRADLEGDAAKRQSAWDALAHEFDKAAEEYSGQDRRLVEFLHSYLETAKAKRQRYDRVLEAWLAIGGADPSTIGSEDAMHERLQLTDQLQRVYADLWRYIDPDSMRPRLVRDGFAKTQIDQFMRQYKRASQNDRERIQYQLGEQEYIALDAHLGMIWLLSETYGHWEFDPETGQVIFDEAIEDSLIEQFNTHADRLNEAVITTENLQQELIKIISIPDRAPTQETP